jgi:hypothetical protein
MEKGMIDSSFFAAAPMPPSRLDSQLETSYNRGVEE